MIVAPDNKYRCAMVRRQRMTLPLHRQNDKGFVLCTVLLQIRFRATAIGGTPRTEIYFLAGRLRLTLFPKNSDSISGRGSNTQPFD